MNKLERYLVDLLQGRLSDNVQVVKQFSQHRSLPVVTLDTGMMPVTQDFRELTPVKSHEYLIFHREAEININVWCNTEEERERITQEILHLFYMEQTHHYSYCVQYNKDTQVCNTTGEQCEAITKTTGLTAKHRCPRPYDLNYRSISYKYNIENGSLNINPPYSLDELNEKPPLLRSIMYVEAEYSDIYDCEGHELDKISYNELLN